MQEKPPPVSASHRRRLRLSESNVQARLSIAEREQARPKVKSNRSKPISSGVVK